MQLRQLQTKLSAANTRVAELEAQAAQDNPLALEANHYGAREHLPNTGSVQNVGVESKSEDFVVLCGHEP